ncbi:MAG TPA: hypothetical protein VKS98_08900 [Chthoniobacterales bacterium]|nr:hypothetical protein [Chthoniobacterales bacterium]
MNSQRNGLRLASLIFAIVAIAHAVRLFRHTPITFGSHVVPMGLSWVALIFSGVLCIWMWRLASAVR